MNTYTDRMARLQTAENRANRRDFDLRYGNQQRAPYGYVRTRQVKKPETTLQALQDLGFTIAAGLCVWLTIAMLVK